MDFHGFPWISEDFHGIPWRYFTRDCFQFLLGVEIAPRETENNPYAKFGGDKQRALWYVMVFSGVVDAKCTHDHSIFRTIDGSTRELLAKQLKKYIWPAASHFCSASCGRVWMNINWDTLNKINNLLWLFFIYCFYPCVIFKSVWYARHFEYSCKRRSLNDWKQTAQRLKLQY